MEIININLQILDEDEEEECELKSKGAKLLGEDDFGKDELEDDEEEEEFGFRERLSGASESCIELHPPLLIIFRSCKIKNFQFEEKATKTRKHFRFLY